MLLNSSCSQILSNPNPLDGSPAYCSWLGITCCSRPAVVKGYCTDSNALKEVKLEVNGLQGAIDDPAFMQSLAQLHACGLISLSLAGNSLSGSMTDDWGQLTNLASLNLGEQ